MRQDPEVVTALDLPVDRELVRQNVTMTGLTLPRLGRQEHQSGLVLTGPHSVRESLQELATVSGGSR